ncbi:MAG TPA: hypothetical protein VGF48_10750 [Thermoanaerobaculia bacterium]|jgi:hypothetical protein
MPYKVQFAGLVCFYRKSGVRLALLPDGRNPGAGIDPHYGSIVIHEDWIEDTSGWSNAELEEPGVFPLESCDVTLEGADVSGTLDVSEQEGKLPQLRQIDPDFVIDPDTAPTVARIPIRRGTLTAYRVPQGEAVVSELVVPHDGSITITVTPRNGSPARTICVMAGAEIAIGNMAKGVYRDGETEHAPHFKIYEVLSSQPVSLVNLPASSQQLNELQSQNPIFTGRGPIGLYVECSNTGCC